MKNTLILLTLISLLISACQPAGGNAPRSANSTPKVLAVETFLADIAQNVAGDRLNVESLIPTGLDPHAFVPTPRDVAKISDSQALILNGANLEAWLEPILKSAGGERLVVEAAAGLKSRQGQAGEPLPDEPGGTDPHFWLDPNLVIHYVENIRDGLAQADPAGKDIYTNNAQAYIDRLKALDAWIVEQVGQIPPERRLLVTNHESMGYFADRYGFKIVGAILPSVSTGSSPSAQELAQLVDHIRASGAPAIFLETGANPQLAEQLARETGIKVVTQIYTHSITAPDGDAPTYIDMMRYNVKTIVEALK
jgi:ABC-type Zn uptake system ZnuABC Zn-binding protein ZnuA